MKFAVPLRVLSLTVCFSLLVLAGCDSSGPNTQNQPPSVDVTVSSSTVDVGTQVTLDGSGTSDPNDDNLSYNWSLDAPSGSNASLSDVSAQQPTFTPDVAGDYTATLDVSDGDATSSESTTITAQSSTTELSGTISSDSTLTADEDYLVTGTVEIEDGATLTIEPGTHLPFESEAALNINSNSVLDANGTSSEPITMTATEGDEQQGWWGGVAIYSAEPNNRLNHVEIRHAGSEVPGLLAEGGGLAVAGDASVTLTNATIAQSGTFGVYLDGTGAELDGFSNNTFSDNADAPVYVPFTSIGAIDGGSTFADGTTVRIWGATLSGSDATVTALNGDTPYRFTDGSSDVGQDATLTVDPGVEMRFASGVGLNVDDVASAVLSADGSSENPIRMTATEGNEEAGWWRGIAIYSGNANNLLDHVIIRHGGSDVPGLLAEGGGLALAGGASVTLTNTTIAQSGTFGLYLDGTGAELDGFSENSFSGNTDAPVYIPFTRIGAIDGGSTFPDGKTVRVWGATLSGSDATVTALDGDTPYRFTDGNSDVGQDATLTVDPGVEMHFAAEVGLDVDNFASAVISADGTSNNPIRMTATEGNGEQGWWQGVAIYSDNPNNLLNHVIVRHGGSDVPALLQEGANVALAGDTALELTNAEITDSGANGVYCDGSASFTTSGNTYSNNGDGDVVGCP